MKKETKEKLEKLMQRYEQARKQQTNALQKESKEDEVFLDEFKRIQDTIIRPVMEELGGSLKACGHDYKVSVNHGFPGPTVGARLRLESKISMEVFPAGIEPIDFNSTNTPTISFTASSHKRVVSIWASNMTPGHGGSSGPRGELSLKETTKDRIEEEVLKLLAEVFDPKRPV